MDKEPWMTTQSSFKEGDYALITADSHPSYWPGGTVLARWSGQGWTMLTIPEGRTTFPGVGYDHSIIKWVTRVLPDCPCCKSLIEQVGS